VIDEQVNSSNIDTAGPPLALRQAKEERGELLYDVDPAEIHLFQ
jgi:hypothetical protein